MIRGRSAAVLVAALVLLGLPWVSRAGADRVQDAAEPAGRVVLVGDSIMLGARSELEESFSAAGYDVVVDATESRSTSAGADTLGLHLAGGADAVVVMLGANDAGNTDTFRTRVRSVLERSALVPRLYWLTIPEVRSYYPAANQVLREELATRPGAEVLDWHAVSSGEGITAGDGLHLTPGGADTMAWFVTVNVDADLAPPPSTVPTTAAPSSTTAPEVATTSGSANADVSRLSQLGADLHEAGAVADSSIEGLASTALRALLAVLSLLGIAGIGLAGWSIVKT